MRNITFTEEDYKNIESFRKQIKLPDTNHGRVLTIKEANMYARYWLSEIENNVLATARDLS